MRVPAGTFDMATATAAGNEERVPPPAGATPVVRKGSLLFGIFDDLVSVWLTFRWDMSKGGAMNGNVRVRTDRSDKCY